MNEKIEYALRYFELHANQRISTFNFFIVLSALLTTALVKTFENDFGYPFIGYGISIALMWVSIISWKLDQRVSFLIKHSEDLLKKIEESILDKDPSFPTLFSSEEIKTEKLKSGVWRGALFHHLSYSRCFEAIYFLFFLVGLIGIVTNIFC